MKNLFKALLPARVDNTLPRSKLPFYFFAVYALLSTARSLVHLLAPDGGAGSIAGMDLSIAGADGIIFAFALWGSAQLLLALIQWMVILRYRSLMPLMYLIIILDILLRLLVGHMRPVSFAHTPPGAIGNYIVLPLAALMLVLSLWPAGSGENTQP